MNLREQWEREGYVVLHSVFDSQRTEQLRVICESILDRWRVDNPENGKPGGGPDATVMRHLNHPGYFAAHPEWLTVMLEAVGDERVLDAARTILGEEPLFRCTSFFFNPLDVSREGEWHRDSQFTSADDEEEKATISRLVSSGTAIQMQIPLVPSEDVEYVPASHLRWDTPAEYKIRRADGGKNSRAGDMPGALRLELKAGDAAMFNPFGIHRGRYYTTPPRRTLMLTYTKASAPTNDYFSDQPWFLSGTWSAGLKPATRNFFERFVEQYKSFWTEKKLQAVGT